MSAKSNTISPKTVTSERARKNQLANHYHRRDAAQFTDLHMETISFEEAENLVEAICLFDFAGRYEEEDECEGTMMLVRLIAGIAAIEDHEYRQLCAERAIRKAFTTHTNAGTRGLAQFVAKVNAELSREGESQ
jgi:hypothetical protein